MLLIGVAYYAVSYIFGILSFSSALYFLAGAAIRQSGKDFRSIFWASPFALLIFATLVLLPISCSVNSLFLEHLLLFLLLHSSLIIVYFAISSLLYTFHFSLFTFHLTFLGRNSLPLYVLSPIFTILCKRFVPYLQFDPTGLIFLLVSLVFCVSGSLAIAWAIDKTGISRYFFGRKAVN